MTIYFMYALLMGIICSVLVTAGFFVHSGRMIIVGMVFSAIVASPVTTFTYGTAGAIYVSDMVGFVLLICYITSRKNRVVTYIVPRWYKSFVLYMILAVISAVVVASIAMVNLSEVGLAQKINSPIMGQPLWLLMAVFRVIRIILFMIFFTVACHLVIDEGLLEFTFKTVLISIVMLAICQIINFMGIKDLSLFLPWDVYQGAHILGHSKAAAGRLYVMGIFLAMAIMYRSWKGSLYLIYLGIVVIALLFSGSRAALVGVMAGFMIFVWRGNFVWKIWALILLALIPVGFLILAHIDPERIQHFAEITENPSENSRWQIWSWSLQNLAGNPVIILTGVGFSNFRYALISVTNIYHAHNDYLTCITEMGIFGLAAFICYLIRLIKDVGTRIKNARGKGRWQAICLSCILAGFLMSSLFEFSLYYSVGSVPMQRIFGILFGVFSAFWVQQGYLSNYSKHEYTTDNQLEPLAEERIS